MQDLIDQFKWIQWGDEQIPAPTSNDVLRVERELGFKIPEDYVEVIRKHPGKMPVPGRHDADGNGSVVGELYHFHGEINLDRLGYGDFINNSSNTLLLAFSRDPGGNFFAFDYGDDPQNKNPSIVFWDHETSVATKVAESFTEFLSQLKEE